MPYCGKRLNRRGQPWGWKSKRWSTAPRPEMMHREGVLDPEERAARQKACYGETRDAEFFRRRREQKRNNAVSS